MDKQSLVQLSVGLKYVFTPKLQRMRDWNSGKDKQFLPTLYNVSNCLSVLGWSSSLTLVCCHFCRSIFPILISVVSFARSGRVIAVVYKTPTQVCMISSGYEVLFFVCLLYSFIVCRELCLPTPRYFTDTGTIYRLIKFQGSSPKYGQINHESMHKDLATTPH